MLTTKELSELCSEPFFCVKLKFTPALPQSKYEYMIWVKTELTLSYTHYCFDLYPLSLSLFLFPSIPSFFVYQSTYLIIWAKVQCNRITAKLIVFNTEICLILGWYIMNCIVQRENFVLFHAYTFFQSERQSDQNVSNIKKTLFLTLFFQNIPSLPGWCW